MCEDPIVNRKTWNNGFYSVQLQNIALWFEDNCAHQNPKSKLMTILLYLSNSEEPPHECIDAVLWESNSSSSVVFSSATLAKLVWPSRKTIDSLADRRWEPLLNGPSGASTNSSTHVDCVWKLWNSWLAAVSEGVRKCLGKVPLSSLSLVGTGHMQSVMVHWWHSILLSLTMNVTSLVVNSFQLVCWFLHGGSTKSLPFS